VFFLLMGTNILFGKEQILHRSLETASTIVWPKKLKVGNVWLHKAALVTHKNISLCAKFYLFSVQRRNSGKKDANFFE